MADYQVTVSTSYLDDAGTCDHVFIKLVGEDGKSERTRLMDSKEEPSFIRGTVSTFTVSCPVSIGKLVTIKLDKQPSQNPDKWFPTKVEVKSPEGDTFKFLICQWITDSEVYRFREGREPDKQLFQNPDIGFSTPAGDTYNFSIYTDREVHRFRKGRGDTYNFSIYCRSADSEVHRFREGTVPTEILPLDYHFGWEPDRKQQGKDYRWYEHIKGIPHGMKAENLSDLPSEVQFSFIKKAEFRLTAAVGLAELYLKGLADSRENWRDIDDIKGVFWCKRTDISDPAVSWSAESEFRRQEQISVVGMGSGERSGTWKSTVL